MKIFSLVCSTILCLAVSSTPAVARKILPGQGSPGAGTETEMCPAGEVLSGFSGRMGAFIDKLQLHCAPLMAGGVIGESGPRGRAYGGDGGGPYEDNCGAGSRPGQFSVKYNAERKQALSLSLDCGGSYLELPNWSGVGFGNDFHISNYNCGDRFVTGLVISSGRHVNSIGVVCDTVTVADVARPPPKVLRAGRGRQNEAQEMANAEFVADRQVTGKSFAECALSRDRCFSRCGGPHSPACAGMQCEPYFQTCVANANRAQAEANADFAEERRVTGKSPSECAASRNSCFSRCGGPLSPACASLQCEPNFQACLANSNRNRGNGPVSEHITVVQSVDMYSEKYGEGRKTGILYQGTTGVTLVEPCDDNWCHVRFRTGSGWVYNGDDYKSLEIP